MPVCRPYPAAVYASEVPARLRLPTTRPHVPGSYIYSHPGGCHGSHVGGEKYQGHLHSIPVAGKATRLIADSHGLVSYSKTCIDRPPP